MDTISHLNLLVSGYPFTKITELHITHNPNGHGLASIVGELDPATAQDCISRTDERTFVEVTTTAEGQTPKLFCGFVKKVKVLSEAIYSVVQLELISASIKADLVKGQKSFQNAGTTYEDMLSSVLGSTADIHMMVTNTAIGGLILQFNETGWEFALRMASQMKAPLVTDITSPRAQFYVGLPPASRTRVIDTSMFGVSVDSGAYAGMNANSGNVMQEDFSGQNVTSFEYGYIGDKVQFNGKTQVVKSVSAQLTDGNLVTTFGLLTANAGKSAGGSISSIALPPQPNAQSSGKMMRGKVEKVVGDKVQVHLIDIDPDFDSSGTWEFPYSTAYSSGDTSGFYCMPEEGDIVRVFFPSGNEKDGFAASSVCAEAPADPRVKRWKAPGGKEILLADDGIYITSEKGKVFINLKENDGIEIHCNTGIYISSAILVSVNATHDVKISATNQIVVGTPQSYLQITPDGAVLTSEVVAIS